MPSIKGPHCSPHKQRGAVAISATVLMLSAVLFLALVVDTGRLFLEKRSLQQKADLAAIEAAQIYCAGFNEDNYTFTSNFEQSVKDALKRNNFDVDMQGYTLELIQYGQIMSDNQSMRYLSGTGEPDAIEVRLSKILPASLSRALQPVTMTASASAQRDVLSTLSVSSGALDVNTQQSAVLNALIGGLLGSSVQLSLGLQDLAHSSVNLAELTASAGVANASDLMNLSLSVDQWFDIIRVSLQNQDTPAPPNAISDLGALASSATGLGSTLEISDLFSIADDVLDDDRLMQVQLPILDLVLNTLLTARTGEGDIALTLLSSGNSFLDNLLGDAIDVAIRIQQAPKIGIGKFGSDNNSQWKTQAEAAALEITATLNLSANILGLGGLLNTLSLSGETIFNPLTVRAVVSESSAHLRSVSQCPAKLNRVAGFDVGYQSNLNISAAADPLLSISVPGVATVRLPLALNLNYGGSGVRSHEFFLDDLPSPVQSSPLFTDFAGQINLSPHIEVVDGGVICSIPIVGLICGVIKTLSNVTSMLVTPMLSTLTSTLVGEDGVVGLLIEEIVEPLLTALGVSTGGVHYRIIDIEEGGGELKL